MGWDALAPKDRGQEGASTMVMGTWAPMDGGPGTMGSKVPFLVRLTHHKIDLHVVQRMSCSCI